MQKIILAFLSILPLTLIAQSGAVKKSYEISTGFDAGTTILPSGDGYVIFGNARQNNNNTLYDIFMLRLDAQGNQLSVNRYGGQSTSEGMGRSVIPMPDGGWLLAGGVGQNGYLLRLNATGAVLWSKTVTEAGAFNDIAPLPDGGFIATSSTANNYQLSAFRFTDDGQIVWQNNYNLGIAKRMFISKNGGNIFVLSDLTVSQIRSANGALVWSKTVPNPNYKGDDGYPSFTLRDMIPTSDGRFAISGSVSSDQITTLYSAYYAALWTEDGDIVWTRLYNDEDSGFDLNEAYNLSYMPNSKNILLAGVKSGSCVVMRLSETGAALDSVALGINGYVISPLMRKIGANYVATGGALVQIQNMNTFFYRSAGNSFRDDVAEVPDLQANINRMALYPNPASTTLTATFIAPTAQTVRVQVSDALGRVVQERFEPIEAGTNRIRVSVEQLRAGTYWLHLPGSTLTPVSFVKD
jgi:hypothetical protein